MSGDNTKIFKYFIYLATISAFTSSLRVPFTFTSDLHSVKTTLEDNRRCLNQVLFPDTHSRNLIKLDRYSLIVPGRRVPFSSSRSITSPAFPTVSSRKILSAQLRQEKTNPSEVTIYSAVDLAALFLLLVTCFLKKKNKKLY
jgi:hypothetical protein